ncbi:4,5-DOPA dioxygenase extradiol [Dyella sp. A6]|uniref:4,5-DOPA-extradiol-dioxygenase n=1 Tax=Dyella aluminiiresistens TaxID=3069105 RepID=UPI002E77DFC9|nr:4,5-DOPA dioxygenase extradiol [Dyella sp. A6]
MHRMPAVFVGHGNPMNAIEDNRYHASWQRLGAALPRPRAIVCVSAHWETRGVYLTGASRPETIHDFYGFPAELFAVQYPAPGDPVLARDVAGLLGDIEPRVHLDAGHGFDHGMWSVLRGMYPAADIPTIQLSLDATRSGGRHYELAQRLAPLRDEGVLIVGSGNIVHNLGLFRFHDRTVPAWASAFQRQVNELIEQHDHAALCRYESLGEYAALAIPSAEHYLPLLYVLAAQADDDALSFFNDEVASSLSMTSLIVGQDVQL